MDSFLIWSWEHMAWWGPNRSGYTTDVAKAGVYSFAEAAQITVGHIPPGEEVAVLLAWGLRNGPPPEMREALL